MLKKLLSVFLITMFFVVSGCAGLTTKPPVPVGCENAYVYKYNLHPNLTAAVEVGAVAVLTFVKDSKEPMIKACEEAKTLVAVGSLKLAMTKLIAVYAMDSKAAPAAMLALSQLTSRLQDVTLTDCDKQVLTEMLDHIIVYAQATK